MAKKKISKKVALKELVNFKEEVELEKLKENLENLKLRFDEHVEAIVEYNFDNIPLLAIRAEKSLKKELLILGDLTSNDHIIFGNILFGDRTLTEKQRLEHAIKQYETLISIAKNELNLSLSYKQKKQMVESAFRKKMYSLELFQKNHDLREKQLKTNKKKNGKKK